MSDFSLSPLEILPAGQGEPDDHVSVDPFMSKRNAVLNSRWSKCCTIFFSL